MSATPTFGLTLGYFERDDRIDSPGIAPGVRDPFGVPPSVVDTNLTRYSATFTGTQKFSDMLTLAYGIDWLREEGTQRRLARFRRRIRTADLVRADAHDLGAVRGGARGDEVRDSRRRSACASTSPMAGFRDQSARARRLRGGDSGFTVAGAWGKAFKLPSFYALGHPLVGNPDLVPERGESYELELSQEMLDGAGRLSATWFDSEFRNAIDFDSGPPPMLVNRNRVDTEGFELAGRVGMSEQWQLDASVTQAKSRDRLDRHRVAQPAGVARRASGALDAVRGAGVFGGRRLMSVRRSIRRSRPAMCAWPRTRAST